MKHANVVATNIEKPFSVIRNDTIDEGMIIIDKTAPMKAILIEAKYAHLLNDINPHPKKMKKVAIDSTIINPMEFLIPDNNEKK